VNWAVASLVQSLLEKLTGIRIIHFPEIKELQKWKSCERHLFDSDGLHPTEAGHAKLKEAVLALWEDAGFPKCSVRSQGKKRERETDAGCVPDCEGSTEQRFEAIINGEPLQEFLTVAEQLEFYGLFKQATMGDIQKARPGPLAFKARKKWDAWMANKGMSRDEARAKYVELASGAKRRRSS